MKRILVVLWMLVLVVAVRAGIPSCSSQRDRCYFAAGEAFPMVLGKISLYGLSSAGVLRNLGGAISMEEWDALCNPDNWATRDSCFGHCPLFLELTAPQHLKGMKACLNGNTFSPFEPNAHLDENHPLVGKELEVEIVGEKGKDTRHGCLPSNYQDGKNYTGKIVLMDRGTCYFYEKFNASRKVNPAASIMTNRMGSHSMNPDSSVYVMSGMSTGFEDLPSMMMGRYPADLIHMAYDEGMSVKGKFGVNCAVTKDPEYVTDNCPSTAVMDACIPRENPAERLCGQCKLSYTLGDNKTRCLYGNDLQPRKADNYMWAKYPMPISEHVYYVRGGGCSPDDYIGLEGKIVMVWIKSECLTTMVYSAYKGGVKALLVGMSSMGLMGGSSVFGIPVHTVHPDDGDAVYDWLTSGTRSGNVYKSPAPMNFTEGEMAEAYALTPAPTMAPPPPEVTLDERPEFEWSVTIIVCVVFIVLLTVAILAKFLHQRRNSVDLPPQGKDGFALPLSVASMGLSLTLLAIIAVVGFVLAYNAGQSATNTALDDGRNAVQRTYDNAVENVEELASSLMAALRTTVEDELYDVELEAMNLLDIIRRTFYYMDNSWDSFNNHYNLFVQMGKTSSWYVILRTKNHFFMTESHKNDDREKNSPHIRETNNGSLYGINQYTYDSSTFTNKYWTTNLIDEIQPFTRIGSSIGNPYTFANANTNRYSRYAPHITKYAMPTEYGSLHPISFLCELENANGTYIGVAEVQTALSYLSSRMRISTFSKQTENMTVFAFDSQGDILSTSSGPYRTEIDRMYRVSWEQTYTNLKIYDTFSVPVNALAGYVKQTFGKWDFELGDAHTGTFEQSQSYMHPETMVMGISFNDGVKDDTRNRWHMEATAPLVSSDRPGDNAGQAIRFDGSNGMYIYLNLTVDIERVARTRVNTSDGSWKSSFKPYANARPLANGDLAIHTFNVKTGQWHAMNREPWHILTHTMSMWVKPDGDIGEELLDDTPILFGDEHLFDPTMSVLGNGQVVYGWVDRVCRTKPIPGGLKGGQWVHLTSVVDVSDSTCAMYVNGKLHSKADFSPRYSATYYGGPYRVGHRYKGLLDDIQVFNNTMTAAEVEVYHNTGIYRRQVPERKWMVQLSQTYFGSGVNSLPFTIAVMMPSEDILRQVQTNNEKTRHNLAIQEENTQKQLDHMTNETVFVLVVIALVSVLIFLVFNDLLTRPFATFACQMTDIAVMKVDEIDAQSSFIREMNAMHRAMALMVGNLKEYKSYMPQTLLAINESSDDDSETDRLLSDAGTGRQRAEASDIVSEDRRSGRSSRSRSTTSRSGRSTRLSGGKGSQELVLQNVSHAKGKKAGMMLSLSKKKVTFAVVNIVNWHDHFLGEADSEMIAVHGTCLNSLLVVFQACKGVPDQFSGDRILCSFNACKPLATHRVSACRAVLSASHKIRDATASRPISLSVGVASGEAKVGNMGTEGMKKFSFISPVLTWTYALERYCRSMELPNLVDFHVSEEAKTEFMLQHVDSILFKKRHATRPIRVSQLVRQKDSKDIEWMYQMDEGERTDPFATWNEACKAVFSGDWKEAEKHAILISADHTGPLLERLLGFIQEKKYSPPTIIYH